MKATVVTMTPRLAKDYLARNVKNRKVKNATLNFYIQQMKNGNWKENGEPIIIDRNGLVKDGQHRLMAVVYSGHSYRVPIISNVSPEVMDTIDTGTNRSSADVLHLEGFKDSVLVSSLTKSILNKDFQKRSSHSTKISNADILDYAQKNKSYIYEITKEGRKIDTLQVLRVLTPTLTCYYLHKYGNTPSTKEFLKQITGTNRNPHTATDYVFKKLYQAKIGQIRLSIGDIQKYIEKAYSYYLQGNPNVKSIKINFLKNNSDTNTI